MPRPGELAVAAEPALALATSGGYRRIAKRAITSPPQARAAWQLGVEWESVRMVQSWRWKTIVAAVRSAGNELLHAMIFEIYATRVHVSQPKLPHRSRTHRTPAVASKRDSFCESRAGLGDFQGVRLCQIKHLARLSSHNSSRMTRLAIAPRMRAHAGRRHLLQDQCPRTRSVHPSTHPRTMHPALTASSSTLLSSSAALTPGGRPRPWAAAM